MNTFEGEDVFFLQDGTKVTDPGTCILNPGCLRRETLELELSRGFFKIKLGPWEIKRGERAGRNVSSRPIEALTVIRHN